MNDNLLNSHINLLKIILTSYYRKHVHIGLLLSYFLFNKCVDLQGLIQLKLSM
jgi:hypothetical protein